MTDVFPEQPDPGPDAIPGPAAETDADAWRVRLTAFEGPLDLLLHLVRINEVDIADIPILEITAQYQAHLELMEELNLEIAGEYLVMAATLMHIKSRLLLPPDPEADEEEADDPRAELTQQLLEYQRFKLAAENLQAMDSRRGLIFLREHVPEEFRGEELLAVDLVDLLKAFRGLLGRLGEEARIQLTRDTVSVAEKITWLTDLLERRKSLDFLELLVDLETNLDRIATFLAVLEMSRLQMLVIFQRKLLGEIRIALAPEPAAGGPDEPAEGEAS